MSGSASNSHSSDGSHWDSGSEASDDAIHTWQTPEWNVSEWTDPTGTGPPATQQQSAVSSLPFLLPPPMMPLDFPTPSSPESIASPMDEDGDVTPTGPVAQDNSNVVSPSMATTVDSQFSPNPASSVSSEAPPDNVLEYMDYFSDVAVATVDGHLDAARVPVRTYKNFVGTCGHEMHQLYISESAIFWEDVPICGFCGFNHGDSLHHLPWYAVLPEYVDRECDECMRKDTEPNHSLVHQCARCWCVEYMRSLLVDVVRDRNWHPAYNPQADPLPLVGIWCSPDDPADHVDDPSSWSNGKIPIAYASIPLNQRPCCLDASGLSIDPEVGAHGAGSAPAGPTWVQRVHDPNLSNPSGYTLLPNPFETFGMTNEQAMAAHNAKLDALYQQHQHDLTLQNSYDAF